VNVVEIVAFLLRAVQAGMIVYLAAIALAYLGLVTIGFFCVRRGTGRLTRSQIDALARSPLVPGVSVLVPAYNEELTVVESVRSMLALRHPNSEIIVVNDGSKDATLARLQEAFRLYRSSRVPDGLVPCKRIRGVYQSRDPLRLVVIDKENGGKADALNAGLAYARQPLIAAVDSDSILEQDGLLQVTRPFLEDPETIAAGGMVRVANGCRVRHGKVEEIGTPRSLLALFQTVEYLRAFLGGRVAFSFLDSLLVISGAFGLFRREVVLRAGGFSTATVGEDMELVVRLHHLGGLEGRRGRIAFVPEPVCWTEVPENLRVLGRQRNRWQRGTIESILPHWRMLFDRRWGVLAFFGMPYFILFEAVSPLIETIGYLLTIAGLLCGIVSPSMALLFFGACVVFGVLLSVSAVLLEEFTLRRYSKARDFGWLLLGAVLESFGYRQLNGWWRVKGTIDWARGKRAWGAMERKGFSTAAAGNSAAGGR